MATKKQKRAAALARREQFMAEERARGLEAQRLDREQRQQGELDAKECHDSSVDTQLKKLRESYVNSNFLDRFGPWGAMVMLSEVEAIIGSNPPAANQRVMPPSASEKVQGAIQSNNDLHDFINELGNVSEAELFNTQSH